MKRVPSFSTRPGFPLGLKVLVVDEADEAESMLKGCGFCPIVCRSSVEALKTISSGTEHVDILLVDAGCLAKKSAENSALLSWARTLPLVLMAKGRAEMVSGITKQGAGQQLVYIENLLFPSACITDHRDLQSFCLAVQSK